ncbi:retinol dehydrogenase 12 [Hypoxylon sp. FL1284]|nr:retinol dehydrogenase 12 [Hypoxylon sp. FL1284]
MGQTLFPPPAELAEKNLPDQSGKVRGSLLHLLSSIFVFRSFLMLSHQVFIVTGATNGLGKELSDILYAHKVKVYLAARSQEKTSKTIKEIRHKNPDSTGTLVFFPLDLDDLSTVKNSAEWFLKREERLNVLWNNAGVMIPPKGTTTKQGPENQLGTNALGRFLFTKLLISVLLSTLQSPAGASTSDVHRLALQQHNTEFRFYWGRGHGQLGLRAGQKCDAQSLDPGNLQTDLQRHASPGLRKAWNLLLQDAKLGAHTELFAGLSPDVKNNAWIAALAEWHYIGDDNVCEKSSSTEQVRDAQTDNNGLETDAALKVGRLRSICHGEKRIRDADSDQYVFPGKTRSFKSIKAMRNGRTHSIRWHLYITPEDGCI